MPNIILLKIRIRKKYKRALLKNASLLFLHQVKYRLVNFTAHFLFSKKKKKTGKILLFTNKVLNNNICSCHKIFEKCEYYKRKLEDMQ